MKKSVVFAIILGLMLLSMYGVYALGFTVGSYLVQIGISNAGSVFTVGVYANTFLKKIP